MTNIASQADPNKKLKKLNLTRRQLLKISGLLTVSSFAGIRVLLPVKGPLEATTGFLSLTHANIMANVYMAITGDNKAGTEKAIRIIQKFLSSLGRRDRFELKLALWSFEQGGLVNLSRFSSLSDVEKIQALEKWEKVEGLRSVIYSALREISYLAYYTLPENWEKIGYSGPIVESKDNHPEFNRMYEELLAP